MNKVRRIFYVDAYYSYEEDLGLIGDYEDGRKLSRPKKSLSALSIYDAYGYTEERGDNIIVAFIKRRGVAIKETILNGENIIEGLIIPDAAIFSRVRTSDNDILKGTKSGSRVAVTWRDVVSVANLPRYDCSIMYTEGTMYKIETDHIVLMDTETIRTHPLPLKNHPAGRPLWYVIPISLIKSIEVIS